MLHRTQILLDTQTRQELLQLSASTGQSMSYLVRRFVLEYAQKEKRALKKRPTGVDVMLRMAESAKKKKLTGPKDLSLNHDLYLYT